MIMNHICDGEIQKYLMPNIDEREIDPNAFYAIATGDDYEVVVSRRSSDVIVTLAPNTNYRFSIDNLVNAARALEK